MESQQGYEYNQDTQAIYEGLPSFDGDTSMYSQDAYSYNTYQTDPSQYNSLGYDPTLQEVQVKQEEPEPSVKIEPESSESIPTTEPQQQVKIESLDNKSVKQEEGVKGEDEKEKGKKKKSKSDKSEKRKKKRKKRSGSRDKSRDKSSGRDKSSKNKSSKRSKSRSGSRGRRRKSHRKHKKRSRSRSRRSKSKSKEKKKEKKKTGWDVAPDPNAGPVLTLIPGAPAVPPTVTAPLTLALGQQIPTTAALMANPALAALLQNNPLLSAASAAQTQGIFAAQARRIYVGNVFAHITEEMLKSFLNEKIVSVPGRPPTAYTTPIYSVAIKREKMFAFIEFYSATDADIAICMDGIEWAANGVPLKIRRPKDYQPPPDHVVRKYHIPGIISTHVDNDSNKVFLGNLPINLTDEDVKQFVTTFGPLKAFNLVKDLATGVSKGYAFFAYADPSVTEEACKGLNGINLGGKEVVVQRATINPEKIDNKSLFGGLHLEILAPDISLPESATPALPSRILVLQNLVTAEEMKTDSTEILDDIGEECKTFGNVLSVVHYETRIFVEFDRIDVCMQACSTLSGRKFANRTVVTCFLPEFDWVRKSLG